MSEIIHYNPEYFERLKKYYFILYPDRSPRYFDYKFNEIPEYQTDCNENLIVLNDDNQIVGFHLYLPTKVLIHGEEKKIVWGHDTFLEEAYRRDLGVDFMIAQSPTALHFGAGLSEINYKIQKKIKTPFLGIVHRYVLPNRKTLSSLVKIVIFKWLPSYNLPQYISVSGYSLTKIDDISQINIPNHGYWFNVESDVEFVRDEHFIDKRFLHNFNTYYLYALNTNKRETKLYFVCRIVHRKGIPILSLVDVRYDMNDKNALNLIFKAVNKIASILGIPFTIFRTTMELQQKIFPMKLKDDAFSVVVGPQQVIFSNPSSIVFTAADSDADFLDS